MLPGLTGDNQQTYILSIIKEAKLYGYQVVVINYRGGGGVPLTVRYDFLI